MPDGSATLTLTLHQKIAEIPRRSGMPAPVTAIRS